MRSGSFQLVFPGSTSFVFNAVRSPHFTPFQPVSAAGYHEVITGSLKIGKPPKPKGGFPSPQKIVPQRQNRRLTDSAI